MRALSLFVAMLACVPALGAAPPFEVRNAWVRAPVAGMKIAAGYMELASPEAAALVAVASPIAERVEMHRTVLEGGVMKMRPVSAIELPAGKTVSLAPGGLHLMLIGLARPLKPGEKVPLALTLERAGSGRAVLRVEAEVRTAAGPDTHRH
ncbi:MAG TPA: copper chaperone PCu(A)C [Burkholderiales bacterium]|nr:copper chaperone PCu(A)C [Burkholderiales bacterium]